MLFCLLFAEVISPKAKKFAKLQVFLVSVRSNFKVLNEVLVVKIENTPCNLVTNRSAHQHESVDASYPVDL